MIRVPFSPHSLPERQLSPVLLETLRHLAKFITLEPMRVLAKPLGIKPSKLAVRVWRLRERGYAEMPAEQQYGINEAGREYLRGLDAHAKF